MWEWGGRRGRGGGGRKEGLDILGLGVQAGITVEGSVAVSPTGPTPAVKVTLHSKWLYQDQQHDIKSLLIPHFM